jgi:hypothetical protein
MRELSHGETGQQRAGADLLFQLEYISILSYLF